MILITVLSAILGGSAFEYAEARTVAPFSFSLEDEIVYNDLWFYVDGSKPNLKVDKGETATFSLVIGSRTDESTTVNFHATIGGEQMRKIQFPPGVNIQLVPNQITLDGSDQTMNVTVHVSEKAPSSKYDVKIVGMWEEKGKIPDFMGTSFSLHVGKDFGSNAVPVNFFIPPLKFHKEGATPEEIVCRNGMILILKYNNIPACVQEETKPMLIQRGWMKTQVNVFDDAQFIESTKNLDAVKQFLSLHPKAKIHADPEMFTVHFKESRF